MSRLVEIKLAAARELQGGEQTPTGVVDRPGELHALALQLRGCGFNVVAQEVELVAACQLVAARRSSFVGGMDAQLGGRQGEDEPALPGINGGKAKYVPKESSIASASLV